MQLIIDSLKIAQHKQKFSINCRCRKVEFDVGEMEFLKVSPSKGIFKLGKKWKLSPTYAGPFEILEKIRVITYKLTLPPQLCNVYNIFDMSLLWKYLIDLQHQASYEQLQIDEPLRYLKGPIKVLDEQVM